MPQDGPRSRFLYVEVPVPTKRARAARAIARRTPSATNTGGHELPETGQTCQKGSSTLSPGPSVKGKEREAEQDPLVISEVRNGSLPGSAQAAPESVLSTVLPAEVSTDIQAAEPSTSTLPSTNLEEAATLAQSLLKPASSSSSTSPTAKPDTEISSPAKQKTRSRRRRKKKRIIVDSEGSNSERPSFAPRPAADSGTRLQEGAVVSTNASAPTGENSIPAQGSAATVTGQVPEPEYTRLGVDEEISKILGRSLHGQRYAYTVKLSGGQRAVVPESALHEYQDLLDDWLTLSEGGWREDGKVYSDSESEEELSNAMRGATDSDDAYSADQREASPDRDEMSEEDDVSSATSSEIPLRIEASRRSEREGAKKKVDYSKQAEYNEEDEDMSEGALTESDSDRSETDDSRSPRRARSTEKDGGRSVRKGGRRSQASKTAARVLDNDDADASEEEFIEGDIVEENLRPEQFHRQSCSNCKASSASRLLPEFIKKAKRKRKSGSEDGEWDVSSIKEYGSWIWCDVCSSSWHWKCLPGYASANGMRVRFKKKVNAKYGPGSHLNIKKTFRIASCPDCLKPHGSTCKFCLKSEEVHDITQEPEVEDPTFGPLKGQEAPSAAIVPKQPGEVGNKSDSLVEEKDNPSSPPLQVSAQNGAVGTSTLDKDLLFRCIQCKRAAHYACIPTRDATDVWQYSWDWHCDDCKTWGPIDAVLAWRPLDWDIGERQDKTTPPPSSPKRLNTSSPGKQPIASSDLPDPNAPWWNAEYLVKFKETSFRHATWVPHSWLYSAYRQRLRNFLVDGPLIDITPDNATRDGEEDVADDHLENFNLSPMPDAYDKIPKEWLTPDRILDVRLKRKSGSGGDPRVLNMKNRISNDPVETIPRIAEIYVKWQGLPYDTATWEEGFPKEGDAQYADFVRAYGEYLKFRDVEIPRPSQKELAILDRARPSSQFKEVTVQPDFITLGKLMDFQLLGVSWLYFNWWIKKGCILADEMGLGKTVQIISFLSILFRTENCKPFLVVVPNSTLQNWQREFARWAPDDMRVVPYYGTRASRRIIEEYELFSDGTVSDQQLRTHVVLTTYECLAADTAIFKRVPRWEALVVDEAQRLKSGPKNLLWRMLKTLRFGHTVLLTGTPVNNNLDELFNLLYFLDPASFRNLDELHHRYESLTPELVEEVQTLAQPYFLRRTKEAVLDLPPLSEVIVPLSMSHLQKIVYKSVLEKNMDALKAIYDASKAKSKKKVMTGKVTNVLMELRKTLCHPYLVREELEHNTDLDAEAIYKNLVEASSKLTFLADFLPKLKERGHRVLLFSQFVIVLNVIERFLEGMKIKFVRLDGNTSQAERQKYIDAYNAPGSDVLVFILTTRAGGVGINLATADTVILFDADFNPFQDLQAISRAHRIGQTKKVMCFKLMVKGTCEEKIIEAGKKKMVLEQLIVDSKDLKETDEEEKVTNVESLLLFGAQALFTEDPNAAANNDINYSARDIDDLITKTENEQISAEEKAAKEKRTIEANKAFSYARVWDRQVREQEEEADKREVEAQRGFWSKMIEAKEKEKKDEELARALQMGRGYRRRQQANYNVYGESFTPSPVTSKSGRGDASDTEDEDFDASMLSDDSDAEDAVPDALDPSDLTGLGIHPNKKVKVAPSGKVTAVPAPPLAPIRPAAPIYVNPLPLEISPNQRPHMKYQIVRSPTPPDITERRTSLIKNLLKRAEMINNTEAIELIRQATTVKTGFEQVDLCQRAATLLTLPKTSVNGTNSGTPSTMQGVLHKASGSYEGDGHLTNGQSSMRTIDATPTGGASSSNSVHT